MHQKKLQSAIQYLNSCEGKSYVFVIPYQVSTQQVLGLKEHPLCVSMILKNPDPSITQNSHFSWLGCFESDGLSWQMPGNLGEFVFLGRATLLSKNMLNQVAMTGKKSIICENNSGFFEKISLYKFRAWRLSNTIVAKLSNQPVSSPMWKAVRLAKKIPGARFLWHKWLRPDSTSYEQNKFNSSETEDHLNFDFFNRLVKCALEEGIRKPIKPIPRRICLVNSGLAAGGAERQIVNTLVGLKNKGYKDLLLIGEYLHSSPEMDFYFDELQSSGVIARPLSRSGEIVAEVYASFPVQLQSVIKDLPAGMATEICGLVYEFRTYKPYVVHGWQDSTSIKVAIAGLIAGVPKIIIASRNVIPVNFAYYKKYMKYAYQAIAKINKIVMLNNSEAGALDYQRWLGLDIGRYSVIRNGVDLSRMQSVDLREVADYKREIGIPEGVLVIGSVFRFWQEKRPMLWLDSISKIAAAIPHAHFLLIGDGPMRGQMEGFINRNGLSKRIHMPGARTQISTPLSAMDAFLLTSEYEGTPNVVLEAQWFGLPVVVTDAGGAREAISEGVTGYCTNSACSDEIAQVMLKLLNDAEMLTSAHDNGKLFVDAKFGVDQMICNTLDSYDIN